LHPKRCRIDTINCKRKAKRKSDSVAFSLLEKAGNIDNNDKNKPLIYAGSEEKMLNLVVEIVVKILLKELL
jgi:hypothetical protein